MEVNESELTSNMGNVLSTSSEKNETVDSTPTSSTDAFTKNEENTTVSDDPISSTSSEVKEAPKIKDPTPSKTSTMDPDADMLGMEKGTGEKITEDVEDLVHDLESLLGESTDSFNISNIRKKNNLVKTAAMDDDLMKDIEAELQGTLESKEESMEVTAEPVKGTEVITMDEPDRVTNITSELPQKIEELPVKTPEISEEPASKKEENTNKVHDESSTKEEEESKEEDPITTKIEEEVQKQVSSKTEGDTETVDSKKEETVEEPDSQQEMPNKEDNKEKMDTTEETDVSENSSENLAKEVFEITELVEEIKDVEPIVEEIKDVEPIVEEPAEEESPKQEEIEEIVPIEESATSCTEVAEKEEEGFKIEEIIQEKEKTVATSTIIEEEENTETTIIEEDYKEKVSEPTIIEKDEEVSEPTITEEEEAKEEEHVTLEKDKKEIKISSEVEEMEVLEEPLENKVEESLTKDSEVIKEPMEDKETEAEKPVEAMETEDIAEEPLVKTEETSVETNVEEIVQEQSKIEEEKEYVEEIIDESQEMEEIAEPSQIVEESTQIKETPVAIEETAVESSKEVDMEEKPIKDQVDQVEVEEKPIEDQVVMEKNYEEAMDVQEDSSIVKEVVQEVLEEQKEEIINEKPIKETKSAIEEEVCEIQEEKSAIEENKVVIEETEIKEDAPLIEEEKPAIVEKKVGIEETSSEIKEDTPVIEDKPIIEEDNPSVEEQKTLNKSSGFVDIAEVFSDSFTSQENKEETPKTNENMEETNQKSEVISVASSESEIISETSTERRMCSSDSEIALSVSQDVPEVSSESNESAKGENAFENAENAQDKNLSEEEVEDVPTLQLDSSMEEDEDIEKDYEVVEMSDVPRVEELPQENKQIENKKVKSLFDTPNSSEASSPAVVEINDSTSDSVEEVKPQKSADEVHLAPSQPMDFHQNLETLRAVESLKSLCGTSDAYPEPSEDFTLRQAVESISQPFEAEPEAAIIEAADESSPEVVSDETDILIGAANDAQKNLHEGKKQKKSHEKEKEKHTGCDKPLSINVDEVKESKVYSPKLIIKPLKAPEDEITTTSNVESENREPLKMTITKQSDKMHSILKIYNPNEVQEVQDDSPEQTVPKLIIKTTNKEQGSPKLTRRAYHSPTSSTPRSGSPRVTGKEANNLSRGPKLIIKPVIKPDDEAKEERSPKLNIKPVRAPEESEQVHSPKLRIKPIVKPDELIEQTPKRHGEKVCSPKVTIKPVLKTHELEAKLEEDERIVLKTSPKVTIKPVVKPAEPEVKNEDDEVKERIVLKINKGNLTTPVKESRKRDHSEEKSEKLKKIKLKFSREGGQTHIVPSTEELKMEVEDNSVDNNDSVNTDNVSSVSTPDVRVNTGLYVLVTPLSTPDTTPTPRKRGRPRKIPLAVETPPMPSPAQEASRGPPSLPGDEAQPKSLEDKATPRAESGRPKRSCRGVSVCDTLGIKPRKPRGGGRGRASARGLGTRSNVPMKPEKEVKLSKARLKLLEKSAKEEELRKKEELALQGKIEVIEVKEITDKEAEIEETVKPLSEFSNIPIPSIEEANVDLTPDDSTPSPIVEEIKVLEKKSEDIVVVEAIIENPHKDEVTDILPEAMFEEETRMSADANSRAQTPAKQVIATPMEVEESQSSMHSTATVESGKTPAKNKGSRLEVHQDLDTHIIAAEQLAEYYWNNNGPFMLQEQVAQFLGIKSFKRKYPNVQRRFVDMQERDFIRESGLASEAMCDLGLTAVCCADILDIMYNDFQDKYEEYCKHQRDKQTKELINKQKAMCLAAIQDKNRLDLTEQAIHSAANWNASFNKNRKEQRKASMDLQTLTVNYPKGKIKQLNKPKIGHYPVSLVPGQFTDFYQEFTPTEINNLPINTMCYDPINVHESDSDSSGSDSDSDSSSSGSSSSGSCSDDGDCKVCVKIPQHQPIKKAAATSTK
ncbi:unnamed protein product [Brassicogethes aeneus]|uniref:Uncharacterized protein n=1 Tax=Brassicogethes aeneus TaxID=1431903 RepID=A0A9P0BAJ0_BRAAE|nr:unnamed protein product [Brassicogethes aeneus]